MSCFHLFSMLPGIFCQVDAPFCCFETHTTWFQLVAGHWALRRSLRPKRLRRTQVFEYPDTVFTDTMDWAAAGSYDMATSWVVNYRSRTGTQPHPAGQTQLAVHHGDSTTERFVELIPWESDWFPGWFAGEFAWFFKLPNVDRLQLERWSTKVSWEIAEIAFGVTGNRHVFGVSSTDWKYDALWLLRNPINSSQ